MSKFFILLIGVVAVCCTPKSRLPEADAVFEITKKVADWQIETFEDMGKYRALPLPENCKPWHNRIRYHDLDWHCGALYTGMYQWSKVANNDKYIDWLKAIGERNQWRLHERMYHADDHTVGQFYLSLYHDFHQKEMLLPTQQRFDSIMVSDKGAKLQWYWCDALFMAPPVWARLGKITGDEKYYDYLYDQYHRTYQKLWDPEEQLFFRDKNYFSKQETNGEKIFWARGNGWVFGGLALMIPDLPTDWEHRAFFIDVYRSIAETLLATQREDGTWSAGMLGSLEAYPSMETSGTSFFTFGLAWGLSNGILDKGTYEPVMLDAWNALTTCVTPEGMLGYVQPVGAAPGSSFKNYTEVYGSGAFLAAGSEVYKYIISNQH